MRKICVKFCNSDFLVVLLKLDYWPGGPNSMYGKGWLCPCKILSTADRCLSFSCWLNTGSLRAWLDSTLTAVFWWCVLDDCRTCFAGFILRSVGNRTGNVKHIASNLTGITFYSVPKIPLMRGFHPPTSPQKIPTKSGIPPPPFRCYCPPKFLPN